VDVSWDKVANAATGMSHAEIVRACENSAKAVIIADRDVLTDEDVIAAIDERRAARRD
jgi:ATP-dependent 26S proteasome regulatory subunit